MGVSFTKKADIPNWEFRLVFGRTRIEYDPDKERENRRKHKISLESAVILLERLIAPFSSGKPLHTATSEGFLENGEVRHMHLCIDDDGRVLFLVTTMRDDEVVRVISIRHASEDERSLFNELTGYAEPHA